MRKYLSAFLFLATAFCSPMTFANYLVVNCDQISLTSESIFVNVDNQLIEVESINTNPEK